MKSNDLQYQLYNDLEPPKSVIIKNSSVNIIRILPMSSSSRLMILLSGTEELNEIYRYE